MKSFIFILLFSIPTYSKVNVEINGDIRVGGEQSQRFNSIEPYYEGRATFKTERKSGYKGKFEIRGVSKERKVLLYDTVIDYKLNKDYKLALGYKKSHLGREYYISSKERKVLRKSILYQKMESLGWIGRQYQFRLTKKYRNTEDKRRRWSLSLGGLDAEGLNLYFHYIAGIKGSKTYLSKSSIACSFRFKV